MASNHFRNDKVAAPLKHTEGPDGMVAYFQNFRNDKVAAPLKRDKAIKVEYTINTFPQR